MKKKILKEKGCKRFYKEMKNKNYSKCKKILPFR